MSSQIIKIDSTAHLTGCLQQSIRCTDEWSIIVQMNKGPIFPPIAYTERHIRD